MLGALPQLVIEPISVAFVIGRLVELLRAEFRWPEGPVTKGPGGMRRAASRAQQPAPASLSRVAGTGRLP